MNDILKFFDIKGYMKTKTLPHELIHTVFLLLFLGGFVFLGISKCIKFVQYLYNLKLTIIK